MEPCAAPKFNLVLIRLDPCVSWEATWWRLEFFLVAISMCSNHQFSYYKIGFCLAHMSPLKLEYVSFSTHVIPQVFLFPAIRLFDSFIVYARYYDIQWTKTTNIILTKRTSIFINFGYMISNLVQPSLHDLSGSGFGSLKQSLGLEAYGWKKSSWEGRPH